MIDAGEFQGLFKSVLVLGAGVSPDQRFLWGPQEVVSKLGPKLADNFKEVVRLDIDPGVAPDIVWDMNKHPWPVPAWHFSQVHAYECLEHVGELGDAPSFFALWREIWDCLIDGGFVAATTPAWNSVWAWQDPGHKRVYSSELLTYLSQSEYVSQVGRTAMTDYRKLWPAPYNFRPIYFNSDRNAEGQPQGFHFVLQKRVWEGENDDRNNKTGQDYWAWAQGSPPASQVVG